MLKGHIDSVTSESIEGWAYSPAFPVAGKRMLAFSGSDCIGAGEIGVYRPDLESAGLGDGRNGFSIACDPQRLQSSKTLRVRLDESDFFLEFAGNGDRISALDKSHLQPLSDDEEGRLEWMASQGWLTQSQFSMALALNSSGFHLRTFSRIECTGAPIGELIRSAMSETLSAMFRKNVDIGMFSHHLTEHPIDVLNRQRLSRVEDQFVAIFGESIVCTIANGRHRVAGPHHQHESHRLSGFQVAVCHASCIVEVKSDIGAKVGLLTFNSPNLEDE